MLRWSALQLLVTSSSLSQHHHGNSRAEDLNGQEASAGRAILELSRSGKGVCWARWGMESWHIAQKQWPLLSSSGYVTRQDTWYHKGHWDQSF